MSSRARRLLLLTSAAIVAFYACVVLLWAVHPLQDSVPVGIDYTQAKYTAGVLVSAKVDCHTLFSSSDGAAKALPTLTVEFVNYPLADNWAAGGRTAPCYVAG